MAAAGASQAAEPAVGSPGPGSHEPELEPAGAASLSECVLILAPVGQDAKAMAAVLESAGFECRICGSPQECAREIYAGAGALLLTEEALELSHVSGLLEALQAQPPWSELSVIILTSGGEMRLGKLLNTMSTATRGAMLLERPIRKAALVRSLQVALSSRRRQYQMRQLLRAQAQLAAIVTSSEDAIVSKTLKSIVTSWNAGAERMFGYTPEEMIGTPILRLIPPELQAEEDSILARLKKGERIEHYETIRVRKDGTRIPVSLTISPIRDDTGRLIGASKIARDITERRKAEENLRIAKEEAEAASRAKDNFLAALSHELRTPLTPVLMAATSLGEDERLPAEVRAQLAMIERNVLLEARLIDDLLDLSRITHGKLALRRELCDVHSILGFVIEIIRDEAREKSIGITVDLRARRSGIVGDSARLQQVFWNLLRNSVKFTPQGGQIHLSSHDGACTGGGEGHAAEAPQVCVVVRDSGIGLAPEVLQKIFEPFEQAAPGQGSQRGGLGLGLAIARAIVDMHGGVISAESAGAGQGSTFTVELPVAPAAPKDERRDGPSAGADASRSTARSALRLLVVEDDEPTLQVLTSFLARDGHQVVTAVNLRQARAAAARHSFDILISDLGLPDGTGIELMKEMREGHGLRGIVLSGYGMEEDLRRSQEAGFAAHLVKPVDMNELRRVLRRLAEDVPGARAEVPVPLAPGPA